MSGNTKRIALVALVALLATATLASLSVWAEESPPLPPVARSCNTGAQSDSNYCVYLPVMAKGE